MEFPNQFSLLMCGVAHAPLQSLTHQQKLSEEHRIFLKVDLAIMI
jgi:hypothetical protein